MKGKHTYKQNQSKKELGPEICQKEAKKEYKV